MSPEVLANFFGRETYYDKRCDVYSYGILLWEVRVLHDAYFSSALCLCEENCIVVLAWEAFCLKDRNQTETLSVDQNLIIDLHRSVRQIFHCLIPYAETGFDQMQV